MLENGTVVKVLSRVWCGRWINGGPFQRGAVVARVFSSRLGKFGCRVSEKSRRSRILLCNGGELFELGDADILQPVLGDGGQPLCQRLPHLGQIALPVRIPPAICLSLSCL